jgi:hypothetical protein
VFGQPGRPTGVMDPMQMASDQPPPGMGEAPMLAALGAYVPAPPPMGMMEYNPTMLAPPPGPRPVYCRCQRPEDAPGMLVECSVGTGGW